MGKDGLGWSDVDLTLFAYKFFKISVYVLNWKPDANFLKKLKWLQISFLIKC